MDDFKNNLLKSLGLSDIPSYTTIIKMDDDFEKQKEAMIRSMEEKQRKEEKYKNDVLNALNRIIDNTANLTAVVQLLHENNEKQDEIFEIITDIMSIAKEKTKQDAETVYRRVLNRINSFTGDIETITKLLGYATTAYTVISQMSK